MNTKKNPKKVSSYRIADEYLKLIASASEATGLSEAEILERCVLEKVVEVVKRNRKLSNLLEKDEVIEAFAKDVDDQLRGPRGVVQAGNQPSSEEDRRRMLGIHPKSDEQMIVEEKGHWNAGNPPKPKTSPEDDAKSG